ncbi:phosphatidylinositol-specific phospholipase C [Streptomyces qinzhouensis]|uniref:1-phosphatidylinositol phosphodiesterase n=1 Tax=Streptomyces qinzhouensis TaxID=2599401 RepID=A0A5B8ID02_9ACTN|nr:phosphatidylinositol-specific phospholipase C [Streptomyces qinzhouensis]QDY76178.1 phosphatidylinositol-specific phospholipase C [Streptomyces qinzhouensis]
MRRRTFLTGATALAATTAALHGLPAVAAPPRALATHNWMSHLSGSTQLRQLTIPGTHNSGARHGVAWARCQDTTITQQLESGIRFLDIRCRPTEGSFAIHHGEVFQQMMFGDVLNQCQAFLQANPKETVLMRVKKEHSNESDATFRQIFDSYRNRPQYAGLIRVGDGLPPLGTARGKIVLFGENGLPGFRYEHGPLFDIQDDWNAGIPGKVQLFKDQLGEAHASNGSGKLFVNFTSVAGGWIPWDSSNSINPTVRAYLNGFAGSWNRHLGIIAMDYPQSHAGLIETLIARNP